MELVSPSGPVYQAGTFNGNPASLAAGRATLHWLHNNPGIYRELESAARVIEESLPATAGGSFVRLGSMFKYFFRSTPPGNYLEAKECDTGRFGLFWEKMLAQGIFIPPSQFETNFLSTAHDSEDIETIGDAYQQCL
jgi:glutamate-1-semialdehyde 2,1-aminomutase